LIAMLRNGTLELYSMTVQNVMLVAMVFVSAHYLILSFLHNNCAHTESPER